MSEKSPEPLPDGRPPLAREFSMSHMLARLMRAIPAATLTWSYDEDEGFLIVFDRPAEVSLRCTGLTFHGALGALGGELGLWRTDSMVAREVERESSGL